MHVTVLGRSVEGDEHGIHQLDAMDQAAEALFDEARLHHEAKFENHDGHRFILTRATAGHYVVASDSHG